MSSRRKLFNLNYPDHEPIYFDRLGMDVVMCGMVVRDRNNRAILLIIPQKEIDQTLPQQILHPTLDEWLEILKQTDDPQYYETSPDGKVVKAIHRKCFRQVSGQISWIVYKEAGFRCEYCSADSQQTIDHKIPVELGGSDERKNLASACFKCNHHKANMPWDQWVAYMKKRGWKNAYTN